MVASVAFEQMLILFVGIIIGFVAYKMHIIDDAGSKAITSLVMKITLPLFIIGSGLNSTTIDGSEMLFFFFMSLVCYAAAYVVGLVLSRLHLFSISDRRLCSFMTTFGNTGFIGLPFIGGLFGSDAVIYATIFNLPFNFLVFSVGIVLVSDKASVKDINPRMFVNACLIASILAIVFYLTSFPMPDLVVSCVDLIGSASIPLSMIITGTSLGKETAREIFTDAGLYVLSIAKVLVVPLISFALLSITISNPLLVHIGTVLMAMPVAANSTMLCIQYGGNDRMASRGVFLSTLLSVITIPLIVLIMG